MDDVILDPTAALTRLGPLRSALAAHDWGACRRILDGATPSERTLLVRGAEPADPEGFLDHVLRGDPDDSAAAALLAWSRIAAAWRIRTEAPADQVSDEQWRLFEQGLEQAEWVLVEAVARRPDDPTLWAVRLTSARGLGLGLSELRRRHDRLMALDPVHLPGQTELLQALCPKWGGTWEAAFAHGRACLAAAPEGSLNPVVLVDAHLERWFELRRHDPPAAATYLTGDAVRADVVAAAQRSLWHPAFVPAPGWVRVLGSFALVFSEQGDPRAAADAFGRLGALATPGPWDSLTADPAALVRDRRARALAGEGAGTGTGQVRR